MMQGDTSAEHALIRYEAACRMIGEAKSFDEVRNIRDQAEAARAYARQAKNLSLELDAAEIRFRAERRLGEMLATLRNNGVLHGGHKRKGEGPERITLSELNLDKRETSALVHAAKVDDDQFEVLIEGWRARSIRRVKPLSAAHLHRQGDSFRTAAKKVHRLPAGKIGGSVPRRSTEFELFKVRDGRSIGRVRLGEIARLIEINRVEMTVLQAIDGFFAHADSGATVKEAITEAQLKTFIQEARRRP